MTFSNLIAKVQMRYQGFLKVKSIIPVVTIQELLYGYISCKMLLTEIKYHVLIVDKEETKKHGFVLKHVINILLGTCYYHNAQSSTHLTTFQPKGLLEARDKTQRQQQQQQRQQTTLRQRQQQQLHLQKKRRHQVRALSWKDGFISFFSGDTAASNETNVC